MTFLEALNTGYRITDESSLKTEPLWYIQKINDTQFITYYDMTYYIKNNPFIEKKWIIHPDDQKLFEFENKLKKVLE